TRAGRPGPAARRYRRAVRRLALAGLPPPGRSHPARRRTRFRRLPARPTPCRLPQQWPRPAPQDHASSTIKPRFLAAGGDPARVLLFHTVEQVDSEKVTIEDRPFSLARDLRFLEEAVERSHAALLILDSLDTCRAGELREVLPSLTQLAQRSG